MIKKIKRFLFAVVFKSFLMSYSLLVASCGSNSANEPSSSAPTEMKYNFVIFLTDDQRWDTLQVMPVLQEKLVKKGVEFTNAFMTTPVCSPSRASLLAGGLYAKNTGVKTNNSLNGSMSHFDDSQTLPVLLQKKGYKTGFVGKYLHGYTPGYVPPGWTKFVANWMGGTINEDWLNIYKVTVGSSSENSSKGEIINKVSQYLTDFQRDKALQFIDEYGESPFFLLLSTYAPHHPSIPATEDDNLFSNFYYEDRAYNEEDLSDKPAWVQKAAVKGPPCDEEREQDRLESLQAVDRAVGAIVDSIESIGAMDRTIFIFTSDNGLTSGEHHLPCDKGMPYEEAIRVPFIAVIPGVEPRKDSHLIAANLDMGATIIDIAEIQGKTDGLSIMQLLNNTNNTWREEILIETYGYLSYRFKTSGTWSGLRVMDKTGEWKYVEHPTGESELYDLIDDPFEEHSQHDNDEYADIKQDLSKRLNAKKGLSITLFSLPNGLIGQNYNFQLTAWGGTKPYKWEIYDGQLPDGLSLDYGTGRISGVPVLSGNYEFIAGVEDSSVSIYTGDPQTFVYEYKIRIE